MSGLIGIIGLGRLGLCLALNLEKAGFSVMGFDVDESRMNSIQNKTLQSSEPGVTDLLEKAQNLSLSSLDALLETDCALIFVVVPTSTVKGGGYNHDALESVFTSIETFGGANKERTLVVISTTMPGYCDSQQKRLSTLGIELVYNPEFIAQGSILKDQIQPDQVLIGAYSDAAAEKVKSVYAQMCVNEPAYHLMTPKSAEMAKLATNCFLTMKIAFANAVGDLASTTGGEADKILAAVGADQRIGSKYLGYGFGFGGPCFPRDNRALLRFAKDNGQELLLSKATDDSNAFHLEFQLAEALQKPEDEPFVFTSVTYKEGSDILEESQQLALSVKLAEAGRVVIIQERKAVIDQLKMQYGDLFKYEERGNKA